MATKIQVRRDTSANWTLNDPTLSAGEPAVETDTGYMKVGDGSTAWTDLPYIITGAVPSDSTVTSDPGVPLIKHHRNFASVSTDAEIMQTWVNGSKVSWLNEWGALRGRPLDNNKADALVRAYPNPTVNEVGPNGAFEIMSKAGGGAKAAVIRWDGGRERNGIEMVDTVVIGKTDPIPGDTPAGVLIVRLDD